MFPVNVGLAEELVVNYFVYHSASMCLIVIGKLTPLNVESDLRGADM
jgi:hypothetical protein